MIDKDRLLFGSKMIGVVSREFNASCDKGEAQEFVTTVYEQYKQAGSPKNIKHWLKEHLKNAYLSVTIPPMWVEDEPDWPYLNGKPMVFITQYAIPKNEVTGDHLTWNIVLYLFGQRVPHPQGYTVEYRIVRQFPGIDGTGTR